MATYWTIQTISKWWEVQSLGYLTGNRAYIWEEFVEPYHWMMEQMGKRISNYAGEYPVWLWTERPDLRRSGHLEKREQGVLLKIELDPKDVLLSDFQAWHIVLNHSYLSLYCDDNDQTYSADELRKSWDLIFEIDQLNHSEAWGGTLYLQGVTGKIMANQLTLTKTFIAR